MKNKLLLAVLLLCPAIAIYAQPGAKTATASASRLVGIANFYTFHGSIYSW